AMTAINEFSVQRSSTPFLIDISISVDNRYFNTFSADGVIVSTPLGSTAYSLSAGGPILEPTLQAVVITPICSHTISTKPVVVMPEEKISISCATPGARSEVIYDGTVGPILAPDDILTIRISPKTFKMVRLQGTDFFATLRSKMGWTGSLRN
ncbi:MAG: NAD(+)/NADH kinase, partial [Candidatus Saccharimonadales bacterium]